MFCVVCQKVACPLFAAFAGIVAGAASMLLYGHVSPQTKLKSLKLECSTIREKLAAYEGDFSGAMALTTQNLRLTFRRLGCALWPSLISGVPVIAAFFVIGDDYVAFFLATVVTALGIKYHLQIT